MVKVETLGEAAVTRHCRGRLSVETSGQALTDITDPVSGWLREVRAQEGLLLAVVAHTTASLTVQENADPAVQLDLVQAFRRIAPASAAYRHNEEGPDDMPGHVKSALTDVSVAVPVAHGSLRLGQWQALYLWEHRDRPRCRTVWLSYFGD